MALDLNITKDDISAICLEVWKLEKTFKQESNLGNSFSEKISLRIKRFKEILKRANIEIKDFSGENYNEGLNTLDVVDSTEDSSLKNSIIKETITPAIFINGILFKRSKVIISISLSQ